MLTRNQLESIPSIRRRIEWLKIKLQERPVLSGLRYSESGSRSSGLAYSQLEDLVLWREKISSQIITEYKRLSSLQTEIYAFIKSLDSERQKEIVEMHCIDGLTFEEIGIRTSWSPTTVKRHYYQAVCKLSYQNGRNGR